MLGWEIQHSLISEAHKPVHYWVNKEKEEEEEEEEKEAEGEGGMEGKKKSC